MRNRILKAENIGFILFGLGLTFLAVSDCVANNKAKQSGCNRFFDELQKTQNTNNDYNNGYKDAIQNLRFKTKGVYVFKLFGFSFIKIGNYINDERFNTSENCNTITVLQKVVNISFWLIISLMFFIIGHTVYVFS
jgi:hypothetical protein